MPSAMSGSGPREYPPPRGAPESNAANGDNAAETFPGSPQQIGYSCSGKPLPSAPRLFRKRELEQSFYLFMIFQDILDGPFSLQIHAIQQGSMDRKAGITSKSACNDLATDNWQARHETTAEDGTIAKARTKAISYGKGLPHEDEEQKDKPLPHRRRYQLSC